MFVNSQVPTELVRHVDIEDWEEWGCIELIHISIVINPADNLTKPLGWGIHLCHCQRFMGHYTWLL